MVRFPLSSPDDAQLDHVKDGAGFPVVALVDGPRYTTLQKGLDCLSRLKSSRWYRLIRIHHSLDPQEISAEISGYSVITPPRKAGN